MAFARLGDVVVHHEAVLPAGAAPALVFVNSLGADLRVWDPLLPYLGDRFATLRYDKRGHGLPTWATGPAPSPPWPATSRACSTG